MPARSTITIAGGNGFTNVPVTIPAHTMMLQMSDPTLQFDYETLFDTPTPESVIQSSSPAKGNLVILRGPGQQGIIGRPANYNASGAPATADIVAKVRTTAGAGGTLIVTEYEGQAEPSFF